jgi:TonB family protein
VLTFFLHPYDQRFHYHLYFGDGTKQVALARNRHLYQDPGDYRLRVVVTDRGDTLITQLFSLHIRPSVAVMGQRPIITDRPASEGIMPREGEAQPQEVRIFDHGEWQEAEVTPQPTKPQPMIVAEDMPSFPGGTSALQRFLNRNMSYPEAAQKHAIEGKVVVQFVVDANGMLSDFQFIQELGYGCEEAVLHTLALMPSWIPGRHEGQNVPVYYVLPVTFKLM